MAYHSPEITRFLETLEAHCELLGRECQEKQAERIVSMVLDNVGPELYMECANIAAMHGIHSLVYTELSMRAGESGF
jgi:hypothetical protein